MTTNCEFCEELSQPQSSRFVRIYGDILRSRIVASTDRFVAIPTLGQLFEGSLLILPKRHVETFADLWDSEKVEALRLIEKMKREVSQFGHTFLYEHGAKCMSSGGCGIYHAHVHLIPLPRPIRSHELVDRRSAKTSGWLQAWKNCEGRSEYLAIQDLSGSVSLVDLQGCHEPLASQYCRRRLAELFDIGESWDWRSYCHTETKLINTVATLGV